MRIDEDLTVVLDAKEYDGSRFNDFTEAFLAGANGESVSDRVREIHDGMSDQSFSNNPFL
jgi:hypothetical protein